MKKYILNNNGEPIEETDLLAWAEWFVTADRYIACDKIGKVRVSTVFLGLDHSFSMENHNPILFETMIFNGEHDQYQERYINRIAAQAGHDRAVAMVKDSIK